MTYAIVAFFPDADPKLVTRRTNPLAARTTCHELNRLNHKGDFERAFFRFVDQDHPFCNRCGKQDWDKSQGCLYPTDTTSDWQCQYGLANHATGVLL